MSKRTSGLCGAVLLLLPLFQPAIAQQSANNDGFLRRNGQMQVVRNGQPRPMTRDAHLPTGTVITKDGFVVTPSGQRTELREGQGCDLRGRPVAVLTTASGTLALGEAVATRRSSASRQELPAQSVFEQLGGRRDDDEGRYYKGKKGKKKHGKGHGRWKEKENDDD
ncbi:MAG: hypothetical protein JWR44_1830 [Hymenobacter sp.]|nr:hypothetical protein [Hymenobacter sp.]